MGCSGHPFISLGYLTESVVMIRSAVTVSLVSEARGGPFVYWEGLEHAFSQAKALGFDAVEIFAPGPDAVDRAALHQLVETTGLAVAAVGTGAGMVKHGLSLSDPELGKRVSAQEFVKAMIDFGAEFECSAIIGSMQGRWGAELDKPTALGFLREGLNDLGRYAEEKDVPLIYEPLNRYETNLFNTLADAIAVLQELDTDNVKLLADLFHMNIEEVNVADAIEMAGAHIGHVHFVDSNRQAAGFGHTDWGPIAEAIRNIHYAGYISAEVFPIPSSDAAAVQTIKKYKELFHD